MQDEREANWNYERKKIKAVVGCTPIKVNVGGELELEIGQMVASACSEDSLLGKMLRGEFGDI